MCSLQDLRKEGCNTYTAEKMTLRAFILVASFTVVSGILNSECIGTKWQCLLSGECVPEDYVCDQYYNDCDDYSDALASTCNDCQNMTGADAVGGFRKCKFTVNERETCLPKRLVDSSGVSCCGCNGYRNCMDWSDEKDCDCEVLGHFRCRSDSACIVGGQHCKGDMKTDCQDFSDEMVRSCCPNSDCKSCGNRGIEVVINDNLICDGDSHCDDLWDEDLSTCDNCAADNLFRCHDGERCVAVDKLCDGDLNCADLSDEEQCDHCGKPGYVPCPDMPEFCIPDEHLCDGNPDCPNWGDEMVEYCEDSEGNCGQEGVFTCADKSFCVNATGTTINNQC